MVYPKINGTGCRELLPPTRTIVTTTPLPNYKPNLIRMFTVPLKDYKVHYLLKITFGAMGSGKSTYFKHINEFLQSGYTEEQLHVNSSFDLLAALDAMNGKPVQALFIDDAQIFQDKQKGQLAARLLTRIRHLSQAKRLIHLYPDEFDFLNLPIEDLAKFDFDTLELSEEQALVSKTGIVYVNLASQDLFKIDKGIRSLAQAHAYKTPSMNDFDKDKLIKRMGKKAYSILLKIGNSTIYGTDKEKGLTILRTIGNDDAGLVDLTKDYDRLRLEENWQKVQQVQPLEMQTHEYTPILANININDESFWSDIPHLFLQEIKSDPKLLAKAHARIGKDVLERNIELWYKRDLLAYDYQDLFKQYRTLKKKDSARLMASKTRRFLRENNAVKAKISEEFFLKKLQNSTVSPPVVFSSHNKQFFRAKISNQHADIYVCLGQVLAAVLAVKWHFERESFQPSPEATYAQQYQVPCYVLIIDSTKTESYLRFRQLTEEELVTEEEIPLSEIKTVRWDTVESTLRKDLIVKDDA